jgi:Domain of unknown function (DUF1906)
VNGHRNPRNGSTALGWRAGRPSASPRARRNADRFLADLLGGTPAAPPRFPVTRSDADRFFDDLLRGGSSRARRAAEDTEQVPAAATAPAPAAPPISPVFPGLDVSAWDDHVVWLWRWSNLRFIGFYLAHSASGTSTTWTTHWHDLRDLGWGVVPFWLPFSSGNIASMATADGTDHGGRAVARAREARLERGAAIYLDVEAPVLGGAHPAGFIRYINNWFEAVRTGGYTPGTYCSRLDAPHLLGADFTAARPLLFPFSIPGRTRAAWNDTTFQLTPALPETWDVGRDPAWAPGASTVGCQFDWFNAQRDRALMHWPTATGGQNGSRSVDWDMAKVFNPSHARAASAVIAINDRGTPDAARLFCVRGDRIEQMQRPGGATSFSAVENLNLGPADIGPTPAPVQSGFDPAFVGAASRRGGCADVFVLGLDGFVRTLWVNPRETFPHHPWALNPSDPARKGSPIYAAAREVDQLDVFYVGEDHQLVTQWWSPTALDWTRNRRVLAGPQVAGGSNIGVLGQRRAGATPGRLDVFYVSLDHARPYAAGAAWNDAWQVVHGVWTTAADWQLTPIRGLEGAAAASGVTVARDPRGMLHAVVQTRDRNELRHATLAPGATDWDAAAGPRALPAPTAGEPAAWWMTLRLNVFPSCLLLVGVTSAGQIAWATWQRPGGWSAVQTAAATFSTGRRLAVARRGAATLDVVGLTEDGDLTTRTFEIAGNGTARIL